MFIPKLIFFFFLFVIFYVYFIYPLIIFLFSKLFDKHFKKGEMLPSLSIIIAAYDEEKDIALKLKNTLSLDYPKSLLEIIVGSDGSTDRTNEIVRGFETNGVKLIAFHQNRGKTWTQNDCVKVAKHDIIIFMDAASVCDKNALRKIVANFDDSRVGAVAGRIVYTTSRENLVTKSQGLYWRYEQLMKRAESKLGALIGVDGPLYAVKRNLYTPLPLTVLGDLMTPLLIRRNGYSVVLEPEAVSYEHTTKSSIDEIRTRRRVALRGFIGLFSYPNLLNPLNQPLLACQIVSRKIFRWAVPIFFLAMMISLIFLIKHIFYLMILLGMISFLIFAFFGFKNIRSRNSLFLLPYYFTLVNWAALLGIIDFLRGKRIVSWKPIRD